MKAMSSSGNGHLESPPRQGGASKYKWHGKPHVPNNYILKYQNVLAYMGKELEGVPWIYATARVFIKMSHIIGHWLKERHDATLRRMHYFFNFC